MTKVLQSAKAQKGAAANLGKRSRGNSNVSAGNAKKAQPKK